MATSDLDSILVEWAAAWSSHDVDRVLQLFTDDCVYEDVTLGAVMHGKDELRAFAAGAFAAVPDFAFKLTSTVVGENRAAIEWTMSGTHAGEFPGMPATGKKFSGIRGVAVMELKGLRIRRNADYWDSATFMRQVGLLRPPGQGASPAGS